MPFSGPILLFPHFKGKMIIKKLSSLGVRIEFTEENGIQIAAIKPGGRLDKSNKSVENEGNPPIQVGDILTRIQGDDVTRFTGVKDIAFMNAMAQTLDSKLTLHLVRYKTRSITTCRWKIERSTNICVSLSTAAFSSWNSWC